MPYATFPFFKSRPIKPFLLIFLCCFLSISVHAAMRVKTTVPVLHSVFDGKARGFYLRDEGPAFEPAPVPTYTPPQHRRRNAGRAMTIAGCAMAGLGTSLLININSSSSTGAVDDFFNSISRGIAVVFIIAGILVLMWGLTLFSDDRNVPAEQ